MWTNRHYNWPGSQNYIKEYREQLIHGPQEAFLEGLLSFLCDFLKGLLNDLEFIGWCESSAEEKQKFKL